MKVTPRAGVWIEIGEKEGKADVDYVSLPVRECGLKSGFGLRHLGGGHVTPRAGVWIEMICGEYGLSVKLVTPRAGVWIEIMSATPDTKSKGSLPVRECGLK